MKIRYFSLDTVDCTADPHVVDYRTFEEIKNDVIKVVKSDLVYAVEDVTLYVDGAEKFGSDILTIHKGHKGEYKKVKSSKHTKKNKVDGLYFYRDHEGPPITHLPLGVTGVKAALERAGEIFQGGNTNVRIVIGVVWSFVMDSSCSDQITMDLGEMTVNYSNQDWWITAKGYANHIDRLSELLGQDIEYHENYGKE